MAGPTSGKSCLRISAYKSEKWFLGQVYSGGPIPVSQNYDLRLVVYLLFSDDLQLSIQHFIFPSYALWESYSHRHFSLSPELAKLYFTNSRHVCMSLKETGLWETR